MDVFEYEGINPALLQDAINAISDHYSRSEAIFVELEQRLASETITKNNFTEQSLTKQSELQGLVHSLSSSIQSIKAKLVVVNLRPCIDLILVAEDVVALMKQLMESLMVPLMVQRLAQYTPLISDVVLLIIDRICSLVVLCRNHGEAQYDNHLAQKLQRCTQGIALHRLEGLEYKLERAIQALDPSVVISERDSGRSRVARDDYLDHLGLSNNTDLRFFRDLIEPIEERYTHWQGRNDRILKMALILNELGGNPVDPRQLAAAVYAHDFGMAFMPLELLHKAKTLTDSEILLLRSHVQSSACLLQHMEHWQPARQIVLQHHEAANGSGYPCGLREKEINEGAKILAIADTFDALTHSRAYSSRQKRPIIRAVKEVNDSSGVQLSGHWVDIFNQAVQPVLLVHHAKQSTIKTKHY
jgi:HD-GYP domain-containing protein (c-di-GMP phosphodiesterase class II)